MAENEGQDEHPDHTDHHGMDASEKPEGGAKNKDNPEPGQGTGEGDGGLGTQTDARESEATEPEDGADVPDSQQHPHGQSGR